MSGLRFPGAFLGAALTLALVVVGCDRRPPRPTNLILISVDTLRPDRLGAYGATDVATPNIDALAERGTVFTHAYAPMPRTTPAVGSMMTGLWPHHHGSREVHRPVKKGTMLTTPLKQAGFATVGITANPTVGSKQGFDVDFDVFQESLRFRAAGVTKRAIQAVGAVPADQPVFLWAHYYDPHWPYKPPGKWRRDEAADCEALSTLSRGAKQSNHDGQSAAAMESCRLAYDSEVAYVDHEIGRLIRWLESAGRLDDALIVFTSDHGENFGEGDLFFAHGRSVHDAGLRVPLIVSGKGLRRGDRDDTVIRLVDLAPSILSIMRLTAPDAASSDGVDFSSVFHRPPSANREAPAVLAFAESGGALIVDDPTALLSGRTRTGYCINEDDYSLCWKGEQPPSLYNRRADPERKRDLREKEPDRYQALAHAKDRWDPGNTRERSVSAGRFKLVERPKLAGGYVRALYDLTEDPNETNDVRDVFPDQFVSLGTALDAWTDEVPGYVHEALTPEEEAQLRALGYVQ